MKLRTIIAAAAACVLALASCTEDKTAKSSIEGEYVGINNSEKYTKQMPDPDKKPEPVSYIVKDHKDGKCTVEIPASHPCVLEGCTVTESNGIYKIHHDGIDTAKYPDYKMPNGFDATIEGDTFKTSYNMVIVAMEAFMKDGLLYTFEGTRK